MVVDRNAPPPGGVYTVERRDTLYSIAWRFGLDYRRLATANGIAAPYRIFPGQRLRLKPNQAPSPAPVPQRGSDSSRGNTAASAVTSPAEAGARWVWPVEGRVVRPYGNGNKGVDIEIKPPARIRAARDGQVVYAGAGLGGFRTLVIVKHGADYLSAYGFNVTSNVHLGDVVKAGAVVADIKERGRTTVMHFEIRRYGKPVSPRTTMAM